MIGPHNLYHTKVNAYQNTDLEQTTKQMSWYQLPVAIVISETK